MQINTYLFFNGNCEEAFRFYAELFGGTIEAMIPHEGSPAAEHVPAEWGPKILHAHLSVGDQQLMASDSPPQYAQTAAGFSVSLHVDSVAEAERVFSGLSEGGQITMALEQTFWAERFGMCRDRFGIPWMINCAAAGNQTPQGGA